MKLVAVHAKLESCKADRDFLDEGFKVIRNEVATTKGVDEKQRARLDAAGAKIIKLKNRQDDASASTATCCKELLKVQKSLVTALEMVKVSFERAFLTTKERDAVSTKYKDLHSIVEKRKGFAIKEMARIEAKVVMVTQE